LKTNYPQYKTALAVIAAALLLTACGKKIDYREAVNQRGLVYRANENTPFNGTIKNEPWGTSYPEIATGSCSVEYKEGLRDGKMLCTSANGIKMVESEWREGKKNGSEKLWEATTSKFWRETHYKDGKKDGVEEVHNPYENEVLISKIEWVNDQKVGSEKVWDITGKKLLKDFTWGDGKQTGFSNFNLEQRTYKNGKPDGVQRTYGYPTDFNQSQALVDKVSTASSIVEKLRGGMYFMGEQPGVVVYKEEIYVDGVWQVKPKNQSCVNTKMTEYQTAEGKNVIIGNLELSRWESACEQTAVITANPQYKACFDAKVAHFHEGLDIRLTSGMQDQYEKECLQGQ